MVGRIKITSSQLIDCWESQINTTKIVIKTELKAFTGTDNAKRNKLAVSQNKITPIDFVICCNSSLFSKPGCEGG